MYELLHFIPTKFSTFIAAVVRVGMEKELAESKALTVFVPTNGAWENLGCENNWYLFSEHGVKDLKKIIQYHVYFATL
jgi:uncharacterized surface protein with fasciclin (FAS1) repeats